MTGQTRVWPVKPTIRPDIVRWPAVILSPASSQKLQTRTLQKQLFNLPEVSLTLTAFCMLISEDRTTSRLPVKPDHFLHQYRVHTLRIGGGDVAYAVIFLSHARLNPQLSTPTAVVVIFYSRVFHLPLNLYIFSQKHSFASYACTREHFMSLLRPFR